MFVKVEGSKHRKDKRQNMILYATNPLITNHVLFLCGSKQEPRSLSMLDTELLYLFTNSVNTDSNMTTFYLTATYYI